MRSLRHGCWIVLALLWAPLAHAATYYVASNGSSSNPGTQASPKSLSWIRNATSPVLAPGDTVHFADGSYRGQGTLKTRRQGTASLAISFVGNQASPGNVVMDGLDFGQYNTSTGQFLRVYGIRFLKLAATTAANGGSANGLQGTLSAPYNLLAWCVFDSTQSGDNSEYTGYSNGAHYCRMDHCAFTCSKFRMAGAQAWTTPCTQDVNSLTGIDCLEQDSLTNCTLTLNRTNGGAVATFQINSIDNGFFERNAINITQPDSSVGDPQGTWKMYGMFNCAWRDNRFKFRSMHSPTSAGSGCTECNTSYMREFTRRNTFERDTIEFLGGNNTLTFMVAASGTCGQRNRDNTWDHCVFVDSIGTTGTPVIYQHDYVKHYVFRNNVVVSRNANRALVAFTDGCDSCIVANNTAIAFGDYSGVNDYPLWVTNSAATNQARNNIVYAPNTGKAFGKAATTTASNNIYFSNDSTVARSTTTGDANSRFVDPGLFGGTSYAEFYNAHIGATSPARNSAYAGGEIDNGVDIGAFQFGDPAAQVYRYWVAPTARGGLATASGVDSTHAITLARANQLAEPGALFILLGGDYTADGSATDYLDYPGTGYPVETGNAVAPLTGGFGWDSTLVVRYVSRWYYVNAISKTATQAPDTNSYRVSAITIGRPYVKVQGLSCGALTIYSGTSNGAGCGPTVTPIPGSWCGQGGDNQLWHAHRDSVTWCRMQTVTVGGCDSVYLNNCWVLTPLLAGASGAAVARNAITGAFGLPSALPGSSNVGVTDCYLRANVNWNQSALELAAHTNGVTFSRCTLLCEFQPSAETADTLAFLRLRDCSHVTLANCRIKANANACETNPLWSSDSLGARVVELRDGAQFIVFLRDTLDLGCRAYSSGVVQVAANGGLKSSVRDVLWQDCLLRGDWAFLPHVKLANWTFYRCQMGSTRTGSLYLGWFGTGDETSDSLKVDACTAWQDCSVDSMPAASYLLSSAVKSVRLTRNIYFRKATRLVSADDANQVPTGAVVRYGGTMLGAQPGSLVMDENLYWSQTDSLSHAAYVTGWARPGCGPDTTNQFPTPRLQEFNGQWEDHSLWGPPSFASAAVDSGWDASLNCRYYSQRAYLSYNYAHGDSAIGARQSDYNFFPGTATGLDTTAATSNAITVSFTAPAADSMGGGGACGAFFVAYSTSANINEGNFFTKSVAVVTGQNPGVTVTKQLTSLQAATIYYFAVKAVGRCGQPGPVSTVQCAATRKAEGTSSTQLCRGN